MKNFGDISEARQGKFSKSNGLFPGREFRGEGEAVSCAVSARCICKGCLKFFKRELGLILL